MDEQQFAREPILVKLALQSENEGINGYPDPDMLATYAAILNEIAAKPRGSESVETPLLTMKYVSFHGVLAPTETRAPGIHFVGGEKHVSRLTTCVQRSMKTSTSVL